MISQADYEKVAEQHSEADQLIVSLRKMKHDAFKLLQAADDKQPLIEQHRAIDRRIGEVSQTKHDLRQKMAEYENMQYDQRKAAPSDGDAVAYAPSMTVGGR